MTRLDRITLHGFKSFANRITIPFPSGFNCVAGPNGSGKSCRGDTEVMLENGELRPIEEIVENALTKAQIHFELDDGVYAIENDENLRTYGLDPDSMKVVKKDISAFIKRKGEPYLYELTTGTGRSVVTTGCHPVMIYKNGKVLSEVVENLREGDLVATPRRLELPENEIKIDTTKIDEDFARLIGYLIGDGYTTTDRIEIINCEEPILDDFEYLVNKFGLEIKYRKRTGKATRLICWNKEFPVLMKRLLRSDSVKHLTTMYKIIPPEIMLSKKSVLANFLGALFDCDGTVRKDNPTFEYTTKSKKLADQVQLTLLRFGIVARKEMKMKHATNTILKKKSPYFYIVIEGKEKLELLYRNIPLRCVHKKGRLEKFALSNAKSGSNLDVLPQEVNNLVRECTKLLGLKYKSLRKKYPFFAAYNENRCCPTRRGIRNSLLLFKERHAALELCKENITPEKSSLLEALNLLNVKRRHASVRIGLQRDTINNSWVMQNFAGKKRNIENLYNHIRIELESRLNNSKNIMSVLENLASSEIFWDKIKKIEKVKGEEWVYDLTIPNCHNFIGNGIFVHNSNVIDAITFVLGTTSARVIRAQKLQNLLFNGGKERKPADFCEVSIYLDNSDGKIPGEKEMKITRRITRSGISIYKLNGRTVTRTKILDIIAYAGLSSEGYNIIMQGDVTNVIEMSPNERREIIDDMSGIKDFDEKREKAVKELERVDNRVRENMIIVAEKQRLVNRLRQEKDAAEKYQKFNNELRKSKASLLKKKLEEAEEKLNALNKEIEKNSKGFEALEKEFLAAENELEKREKSLKQKMDTIISRSRNYEILREIDSIQTDIVRKRDKIDLNSRELERLQAMTGKNVVVQEITKLKNKDVYGTVVSLINVPERYKTAIEVALGPHANDIVVKDDDVAAYCIKFLKERRLGRARFIPLNKIHSKRGKNYTGNEKIIGLAIDLVKFDKKHLRAMEYVFGNTIVVDNIDAARRISDFRIATLDGDLVEKSGAMIGGFYKRPRITMYSNEIRKINEDNEKLEDEIEKLEDKLEVLKGKEKEETADVIKLQKSKEEEEKLIESLRKRRKESYEERIMAQNKVSKDKIEKARVEADLDNIKIEYDDYKDVTEFYSLSREELQEKVRSALIELNRLGPVNMKAIEEFGIMNVEFEELKKKLDRLLEEKDAIMNVVKDVEQKRYSKFMETFNSISANFSKIYNDMTTGGIGRLRLEEDNNIDSGLVIESSPVGKKILNLDVMSGGEKTLTSLSFLFAVMQHSAAPFYILDEIDAALDKANAKKIANLIKNYSSHVQFIVITHNDITISMADKVFGVSMEDGVSKIFGIEMPAQ